MTYKELDRELIESFKESVKSITELSPQSIRVLADISSVLMCLWHPAMKGHLVEFVKETKEGNPGSYLSDKH